MSESIESAMVYALDHGMRESTLAKLQAELRDLRALARRALEQPAPTGEVTRELEEMASTEFKRVYSRAWEQRYERRGYTELLYSADDLHECHNFGFISGYERGRQETQDVNNGSVTPRERLLAEMGLDWTWYRPEVLLDEVDEDPPQALEQPAPTGEVTREHREAVVWAYTRDEPLIWERRWMHTGDIDQYYETQTLRLAAIAQLLATRETAAYERGRQEAQGGWVAGSPQHVALWDTINRYAVACGGDPSKRVYGNTPRQRAVADVERLLRGAPPPPPSDTGKGGGT